MKGKGICRLSGWYFLGFEERVQRFRGCKSLIDADGLLLVLFDKPDVVVVSVMADSFMLVFYQ